MMRIKINGKIEINAPAEKVWRTLAHDFENISQWATIIEESRAITDCAVPEGAQIGGRICSAQGFGEVRETFGHYDEEAMSYTYVATKGLPRFMKQAQNNWSVHSRGANKCLVESKAEVEWTFLIGLFIGPLFKLQMKRIAAQGFEELKYYAEQPHRRKLKAQQKQLQKALAQS